MPDIFDRVGIQAPAEKVYWASTDEEAWRAGGRGTTKRLLESARSIQFRFDDKGFNDMTVIELIPESACDGSA